jgi:hypothetical protein
LSESEKKPKSNELFYRMPSEDIDLVTDIRSSVMAQSPRGGRAILWAVLVLSAMARYRLSRIWRGEYFRRSWSRWAIR